MKHYLLFFAILFSSLISFGQTVNIGDILCSDGSIIQPEQFASSGKTAEGIVFFVGDGGQDGWVVSLECQAVNTHWVTSTYYEEMFDIPNLENFEFSRDAIYDLDGYTNTAIIRNTHGADWYPAAWSVDFGQGWYLPAAGQLRWLMAYINEVNASLSIVHGTTFSFDHPRWYWTSTERGGAHAIVVSQTGSVANYPKWNYIGDYQIGVRAVKSFSVQSSTHAIGEVVTAPGGQKGIVFYVSPEDDTYWLVALNDLQSSYSWGTLTDITSLTNYNENDQFVTLHGVHCGYDATYHMREAMGTSSSFAASHVDLANGWHIPSTGQLSKLFASLPFIENVLIDNGGSTLANQYYWASTECSADKAWTLNFGTNPYTAGLLATREKWDTYSVRPVWSEPCNIEPPTPIPTLPDNILDTDCNNNTPIPFEGGQLMYQTDKNINAYSTPICGDIDDDGVVDIVAPHYTATDENYRVWSNQIDIYSGNNLLLQSTISIPQEVYLVYHPFAIARYPLDNGEMQGAVFVLCNDGKLRSYSKNGQLLHTADVDPPCDGVPAFADFNNDGHPEVYVGNAIYDAATLKQLCVGPANGNKGLSYRGSPGTVYPHHANYAMSYAYNVFGDEKMELVCGNTIYNVNIVSRTNPALNSITINKTITPPNGFPQDGHVSLADLDLDGEIDVVVTKDLTDDCVDDDTYFYAYKPSTGTILFHFSIYCRSTGFPAICNIDTDPHPEILYVDYLREVYNEKMHCLRYTAENGLTEVWNIHHNDPSGLTTMAFFDFNRDEIPEIVFRDAYDLNIINGSDGAILYSYPMRSGTASEHTIIADVNNDGHAEILTTGLLEDYYGNNGHGSLVMFGNPSWPSARQVWNQYAYNVTNINNDLTIPQLSYDNATVFTAPDGTIRRPYNNFLHQAGYITPTGEPYNPSGYVEAEHYGEGCETYSFHGITYNESGDYEYLIENPMGCDTLLTVHVHLGDTVHTMQYKSVCSPYTWNGITYEESGVYQQTFTSVQGCDSIVTLYLNVGQQIFTNIAVSTCDSYSWNGITYDASGIYQQTFTSAQGCDSIVILDLTVKASAYVSPIHGESLIFYQTNGNFTYSIDPVEGCFGYDWTIDGPWSITTAPDSPECVVNINSPGNAILKVRVYTECGFIERVIQINHDERPNVVIYPNPTQGEFNIVLSGMQGEAVIVIYDYLGQFIGRFSVDTDIEGIVVPYSLAGKAAGIYMVTVFNHYQMITKKVIKETASSYGIYDWDW
jgi:hypothetical protein